jgi:hypothetical protein
MEGLRNVLIPIIDRVLRIAGAFALLAIAVLLAWLWWKFG